MPAELDVKFTMDPQQQQQQQLNLSKSTPCLLTLGTPCHVIHIMYNISLPAELLWKVEGHLGCEL